MSDSNTATIPGDVRERVARGLAWIIENGEEYHLDLNRVDLDTLDVADVNLCVLGQARSDPGEGRWPRSGYGRTLSQMFPDDDEQWDERGDFGRDHGFDPVYWYGASALTEAWRQALTVHREQAAT